MYVQVENRSKFAAMAQLEFGRPRGLTWVVALLVFAVSPAWATTLLDPLPENSTTQFGFAITEVGDVNGDGVPDLAIAAPFQDGDFVSSNMGYGRPQNVGKVFILDGVTLSVLNALNDPKFEMIQPDHFGGLLGNSLSKVADLNGDGISDIIAGVPHHIVNPDTSDEVINAGETLVFSGKDGSVLLTLADPAPQEDGKMGAAVAALGDVDGDGSADIVVGVPGEDLGSDEDGVSNVGLAYVFSGKTGQVIRTLNHPEGQTSPGAAFGSAVANAGDVDHDGVSDILVGAPGQGHVFVFSGKTGVLLFDIASPTVDPLPSFGSAVAGGKDLDRDGVPDFVIGAPLHRGLRGAAYVFKGSNGTLLRSLRPDTIQAFARFGATVLASDDVTGDRRADILVGAPDQTINDVSHAGAVFVFDGRGKLLQTLTSTVPRTHAHFGSAITTADFDGDGVATPVVGAPDQDAVVDSIDRLQIGQIEF